jgi:hypothetical protein
MFNCFWHNIRCLSNYRGVSAKPGLDLVLRVRPPRQACGPPERGMRRLFAVLGGGGDLPGEQEFQ